MVEADYLRLRALPYGVTNEANRLVRAMFDAAQTHLMPAQTMLTMLNYATTPHSPHKDVPEEFEPGAPPVEPDEGPVPAHIADDPEHDRVIDPGMEPTMSPDSLALPHERDESTNTTATAPDPKMIQAKRDIDAGLVDTDMHATPGLDAALRERLVPGPGGKPPSKDD